MVVWLPKPFQASNVVKDTPSIPQISRIGAVSFVALHLTRILPLEQTSAGGRGGRVLDAQNKTCWPPVPSGPRTSAERQPTRGSAVGHRPTGHQLPSVTRQPPSVSCQQQRSIVRILPLIPSGRPSWGKIYISHFQRTALQRPAGLS